MKILGELLPLAILSIAISIFAFYDGGWPLMRAGAIEGGKMFLRFAPLFVLAFLVVGEVRALMEKRIDAAQMASWLSGAKGIWLAFLGGIFTPAILPLYPVFKSLWDAHIGRTAILMFLVALSLNWQVFLFRLPLLGWHITLFAHAGALLGVLFAATLFILGERLFR